MDRVLPKPLTAAEWTKNKSKIAKLVGETGVTKELKSLEAEFRKVKWASADPAVAIKLTKLTPASPTADVDKVVRAALKEGQQIKKVIASLKSTQRVMGVAYEKWGKSRVIPASALKYLGNLIDLASDLEIGLEQYEDTWQSALDKQKLKSTVSIG